jgi:hypothetical protein
MKNVTGHSWFERRTRQRALNLWHALVQNAPQMSLSGLLKLRTESENLSELVGAFNQLSTHEIGKRVAQTVDIPDYKNADWSWRPEVFFQKDCVTAEVNPVSGKQIGSYLTLHHDASVPSIILRQTKTVRATNVAPFDFTIEVYDFAGSFLSLALDLPNSAILGLSNQNIFELDIHLTTEHPLPKFVRINVQHGPNIDNEIQVISHTGDHLNVEFDLGYMDLNEQRLEKIWFDLIFDDAKMNKIVIHDITICRRSRAQF